MSVQYRVAFKDGKSFRAQGICFGKLGAKRWESQIPSGITGQFPEYLRPEERAELMARDGNQQDYIDFEPGPFFSAAWLTDVDVKSLDEYPSKFQELDSPTKRQAFMLENCRGVYFKEMKLLLEELPMYKSWVKVHPKLAVIRFRLGKRKGDEVMIAMSLFRNLANYSGFANTYKSLVGQGYKRLFAVTVAHFINTSYTRDSFNGGDVRDFYNTVRTGEYNWFSPDTLGAQGLMNILLQRTDKFDYIQDTWKNQRGYYRDDHFKNTEVRFDNRYAGICWNYRLNERDFSAESEGWGEIDVTSWGCCYWRKMVDAFSVPGDEPIEGLQHWNPVHGFYFDCPETARRAGRPYHYPLDYHIERADALAIIAGLVDFAEANGYKTKY